MSIRVTLIALALTLGVSGCGSYDPPVRGDHASTQYKADLDKCVTDSNEAVRRQNADTPGTWIMSPFTGPPRVRSAVGTCMVKKGYVLDKAGS
jgi:hypothetical protein